MARCETTPPQLESIAGSPQPSAQKLASVAVLTLVVLSGAILVLSRSGYSVARSQGVSMEPYLKEGDALVMRKVKPESVKKGDIVRIDRGGAPILHRVVQIYTTPEGIIRVVTQGDNSPANESPVGADRVRGRLVFKIPLLGDGARLTGVGDGLFFGALLAIGLLITAAAARHGFRSGLR
jgi:signal peptidase I